MDDILKRLSGVESSVSEIKVQVGAITAVIPHLATKSDLYNLKADMSNRETRMIKWIIATVLATAGVVFSIVKFVH